MMSDMPLTLRVARTWSHQILQSRLGKQADDSSNLIEADDKNSCYVARTVIDDLPVSFNPILPVRHVQIVESVPSE